MPVAQRRELDKYYTPASAVKMLTANYHIQGSVLEICAGDGAIADELRKYTKSHITTNDIDGNSHYSIDATELDLLLSLRPHDWVISNPPYTQAPKIVYNSYQIALRGVAMLLRLSFLEPCLNRYDFLKDHPPTSIIAIPRISFTGDGKTDSVATAWFIWDKEDQVRSIKVVR